MTKTPIEQELLALEKQYWQAIKDKDADAAMRLSDDPCTSQVRRGWGASTSRHWRQ